MLVLVLVTAGCGDGDALSASEIEARFAEDLKPAAGPGSLVIECIDRGDRAYECSVVDSDDDVLSGDAEVRCRMHSPGPMGNDVTCSWTLVTRDHDAVGGFSFAS